MTHAYDLFSLLPPLVSRKILISGGITFSYQTYLLLSKAKYVTQVIKQLLFHPQYRELYPLLTNLILICSRVGLRVLEDQF